MKTRISNEQARKRRGGTKRPTRPKSRIDRTANRPRRIDRTANRPRRIDRTANRPSPKETPDHLETARLLLIRLGGIGHEIVLTVLSVSVIWHVTHLVLTGSIGPAIPVSG